MLKDDTSPRTPMTMRLAGAVFGFAAAIWGETEEGSARASSRAGQAKCRTARGLRCEAPSRRGMMLESPAIAAILSWAPLLLQQALPGRPRGGSFKRSIGLTSS